MKYADVIISDTQIFQHIVLLIDRPDFSVWREAARIKLEYYHRKSAFEDYGEIPKEIKIIISEYKYPEELGNAVLAAITKNEVTDKDVKSYTPGKRTKQDDDRYKSHPILGLKVEQAIKTQRTLFVLNKEHIGYRKLAYFRKIPLSSVQTSIKSYTTKLSIPLPWL